MPHAVSDFHWVDPKGWVYDLQSVYAAYMGYFQLHGLPWHNQPWGHWFETFEHFLTFSWPVIMVTDARTGRAHIVTRMSSISAFLKMIHSRFGEVLHPVDNMFLVTPFETTRRQLRHVHDKATYAKLFAMLPAIALDALKTRVRAGDPIAIRRLWNGQDKTFLAISVEYDERLRTCVEWGYAAIRCSHLVAAGVWPPVPDANYRKGHYIISEHSDTFKKPSPTVSWQYAYGKSQVIPRETMPRIVQSVLSSLVSPESDQVPNDVVLVGHGMQVVQQRLDTLKIKLPSNVLTVDVAYLERALYASGARGQMYDRKTGNMRTGASLLSLGGLLRSYGIEQQCVLGNAGNDAFMGMVLFQRMVNERGVAIGSGGENRKANGDADGNGNGNGVGKGHERGQGQVKRAATIARLLLPHPETTPKNGPARFGSYGHGSTGKVDDIGMMKPRVSKRPSIFRLRAPSVASTDRHHHESASWTGSGSGSGKSGSTIGWWASVGRR